MHKPFSLILLALFAGCASGPSAHHTSAVPRTTAYANTQQLQSEAQRIVDAFAHELERARGQRLSTTPTLEVENTPMLIFFSGTSNTIVVPWWGSQPTEMRAVFRKFSGGTDADAEQFFVAFFNGFLVAHEASHWFQGAADRREPTLYENENQANRLAVAFWRTQPGGEEFLARLEKLATRAAANLPDPTPVGEDPIEYFGANYQTLGRDPIKYGYYQFRLMADALRDRAQLDFTEMVGVRNGQ